jgi:hypothetical protein
MKQVTRRDFLRTTAAGLGAVAATRAFGQEEPGMTGQPALKCTPVIRGSLRPYDHAFSMREGIDGWRRELDDEKNVGFNLLWLSHIRPALDETEADTLRFIFDACEERGMGVILETGHTPNWYGHKELDREIRAAEEVCSMVASRYGGHPALHSWYIHQEIYVAYDEFGAYIDKLYPALVAQCRKALPALPVTLSPFFILDSNQIFGPFRYPEPDEYREYWTGLIRRSGFDIIMLQDSGEHFSYVTDAQRRPFFEAMHGACQDAGARLWGNVETAEKVCESIEKYEELYGRVHHSTVDELPWRNVPIDRLESKLRLAAEFSENIVSWGIYQFGRPHLNPDAKAWYEDYKAYREKVEHI